MSNRLQESLVTDAMRMALFRRKIKSSLLLHSDRGSQYASDNFQKLLRKNDIKCSMEYKMIPDEVLMGGFNRRLLSNIYRMKRTDRL